MIVSFLCKNRDKSKTYPTYAFVRSFLYIQFDSSIGPSLTLLVRIEIVMILLLWPFFDHLSICTFVTNILKFIVLFDKPKVC